MSDRNQSSDIAIDVLICALLLIGSVTVGGFFAFRTYTARARAVAEARRAENAQRQLEQAMKAHGEVFQSSATKPDAAAATDAEPLRFVTWNVESGGNDPAVIARQLAELHPWRPENDTSFAQGSGELTAWHRPDQVTYQQIDQSARHPARHDRDWPSGVRQLKSRSIKVA